MTNFYRSLVKRTLFSSSYNQQLINTFIVVALTSSLTKIGYGQTWTQATASAEWSERGQHVSVVYDNKMWVIGGWDGSYTNDVWYSTDGINWTQETACAEWEQRGRHSSVVYNNKIWVMGGLLYNDTLTNDVWFYSSAQGIEKQIVKVPNDFGFLPLTLSPAAGNFTIKYGIPQKLPVRITI